MYKNKNTKTSANDEFDVYGMIYTAKRMGFTLDELKQMSIVTLYNIITSPLRQEEKDNVATQDDIDRLFA